LILSKRTVVLGIEAAKDFIEDLSLDIPSAAKDYEEFVSVIKSNFN